MPFLVEIEVIGAPLSYFFVVIGAIVLLVGGAAIAAIFGTVRDQTSRWAERLLGGVLLVILTTGFFCILALVLALLVF